MNIFLTPDRLHYRRWVNLIPTVFIPGAGQYLSGRRRAGWAWFGAAAGLQVVLLALVLAPALPLGVERPWWLLGPALIFLLAMTADACRRPVPRIGVKGWALLVLCAAALRAVPDLVRFVGVNSYVVPTGAMQPTLRGVTKDRADRSVPGDHFLANRLLYRFREPRRGDIVVFRTDGIAYPAVPKDTLYVKRIAGLPGETISIRPPHVLVNGRPVTEPDIFRKIVLGEGGYGGYALARESRLPARLTRPTSELRLADNEYLLLGDNSANSLDGRYFGPIKRSAIVGRVFYIYSPAGRKGRVE